MILINMFVTCACSYFDGEEPEEDKLKTEIKSEEDEEEICPGQKKANHKSQRYVCKQIRCVVKKM